MSGEHWKNSGWYFQPKSASELMTAIARIGAHGSNHRFAWRGLSNWKYTLTSSLHRQLVKEKTLVTESSLRNREIAILRHARDWGLGIAGGHLVDDLQLLADLQHYGIPTRLIDVTSNPMTALWFATEHAQNGVKKHDATGVLLALNMPWYYEDIDSEMRTVFKTASLPTQTWNDFDGLEGKLQAGLSLDSPFLVSASIQNERLRAQEAYFLASSHPDPSNPPLVSLKGSNKPGNPDEVASLLTGAKNKGLPTVLPFVAIFVPPRVKDQLRKYLRLTYSRTAKTLFPDYAGFYQFGKWSSPT